MRLSIDESIPPKRQERGTEQSHSQHRSKCGWIGQASVNQREAGPCSGVNEPLSAPRPWKQEQVTHRDRRIACNRARVAYSILKE